MIEERAQVAKDVRALVKSRVKGQLTVDEKQKLELK